MRSLSLLVFLLISFPLFSQSFGSLVIDCEPCRKCEDYMTSNGTRENSDDCIECDQLSCLENNPISDFSTTFRCFGGCNGSNPCMPFPPDNTCILPSWGRLIAFGSPNTTRMYIQVLDDKDVNILRRVKWKVRPVGQFFNSTELKKLGLNKSQNIFYLKYRIKSKYRKRNTSVKVIGAELDKNGKKINGFEETYQNISIRKK